MDFYTSHTQKDVLDLPRRGARAACWCSAHLNADRTIHRCKPAGGLEITRFYDDRASRWVRTEGEAGAVTAGQPDRNQQRGLKRKVPTIAAKQPGILGKGQPHPTPPDRRHF